MTRARRSILAMFLLTALLLVPGGTATAHDQLTGSSPKAGSTVEAPDEIVLTFSGAIGELGVQVAVTDPEGRSVVDGEPEVSGTEVAQDLVDDLPAGDYEVVWRVTSEDGHPISGEFGFAVEEVAEDSATDEATDDATDEATTGSTPTTTDAAEDTTSATDEGTTEDATGAGTDDADVTADPAAAQDSGGLPVWVWVVVALAAVGLLGLLARTWNRGRE